MKIRLVVGIVVIGVVVVVSLVVGFGYLVKKIGVLEGFSDDAVPLGSGVRIATAGKADDPIAIGGRVVVLGGGPAGGVRVRLYSENRKLFMFGGADESIAELRTFSNGWFLFRTKVPGPFDLSADASGDLVSVGIGGKRGDLKARVLLMQGGEIKGRVVDEHGFPIAHAVVTVQAASVVFTRRDGTFTASKVPESSKADPAYVSVSAAGYGALTVWTEVGADEVVKLPKSIVLHSKNGIRGRVLDAEGRPVSEAEVQYEGKASRGDFPADTTTDAAGCWFLPEPSADSALPNGELTIHVSDENRLPTSVRVRYVKGCLTQEPDVSLEDGGSITATVRGPDGRLAAGAEAILGLVTGKGAIASLARAPGLGQVEPVSSKGGTVTVMTSGSVKGPGIEAGRWTISNGLGRFGFHGLVAGRYALLVRARGCARWTKEDIDVQKEAKKSLAVRLSRGK